MQGTGEMMRWARRAGREITGALHTKGDKVSRVVRPLANGDKWFTTRVSGE